MTTIILVIIGVLLAAASALFVAFHGGDAFNGGSAKARAATLENAGTNILAATQGYHAAVDRMPTRLDDLKGTDAYEKWVSSDPEVAGAATGTSEIVTIGAGLYYRIPKVADEKVCGRVNKDYGGDAKALDAITDASMGCYRDAEGMHYFVRLGTASGVVAAPVAVKAQKGEPAACAGLQPRTGMGGGERYGTDSGLITAYDIAEAGLVCSYLAAINGPGACRWNDNDPGVVYIVGSTPSPGWSWENTAVCENKATSIPPRPRRNTSANATCSGGFAFGNASAGRYGPTVPAADEQAAMAQCVAWAGQMGEGTCRYDRYANNVTYLLGAIAMTTPGYLDKVVQCR